MKGKCCFDMFANKTFLTFKIVWDRMYFGDTVKWNSVTIDGVFLMRNKNLCTVSKLPGKTLKCFISS